MANQVILKTECLHVKKGGIELQIQRDGKTFGTMIVSNAKFSWFSKGARNPIEMNWNKFEEKIKGGEK